MLKPDQYIQQQLEKLTELVTVNVADNELVETIVGKILSKKFRKYAVGDEFRQHLLKLVHEAVENKKPINMVWVFGGYKLWRIPTSPNVDWAELFSMIYFARYAKSIAEVYKPGVVFDFYSDDVIVSRMDNIPQKDIDAYQESFCSLLEFVKPYLPKGVEFVYNRVADQYAEGEFDKELEQNITKLRNDLPGGLPAMDEVRRALVELNVKLTPGQDQDPQWREKVLLIHDAYALASKRRPYYRNENKVMVVNTPLKGAVAIGTTKSSVAKFWCGMGVLEKRGDNYVEKILSPKQLEVVNIEYNVTKIKGLMGKNFEKLCVLI